MAGPIRIAILANGAQARREASTTARAFTGMGKSLGALGLAGGLAGLTAAAGKFAAASVQTEAQFSQSMSLIRASTKASASQLEQLRAQAIKLGADTSFSANEAADAMLELAKAGFTTQQIMNGGVAGTLQLAAAGGTDLATAATIASNALNTFGLQARDMASVAAALAGGANASSASVESLGQALSQVGPGAVNAGLSLQETVAALAAFDNAGIKGSDAGTSLKTMLARLYPTTKRAIEAMDMYNLSFVDARGNFRDLTNIAEQLQTRLGGLSEAERTRTLGVIFGSDATRAASVLMKEGAEGIREYTKAASDQEAAQRAANARMEGTKGTLERLGGAIETAQLKLGQALAPAVNATADALAENLVPAMDKAIDAGETVARTVAPAFRLAGDAIELAADAIRAVPGPLKSIVLQAGLAALALPRLTAAAASAGGAFTGAVARVRQFQAELTYAETRAQRTAAGVARLGAAARTAAGVGGMVALAQGAQRSGTAIGDLLTVGGGIATGFAIGGPIGAAVGGLAGAFKVLRDRAGEVNKQWEESQPPALDYAGTLDKVSGAATRATRAMIRQDLQQRGLISSAGNLGLSTETLVSAVLGNDKALRRVNGSWTDYSNVLEGVDQAKLKDFVAELGFELQTSGQKVRQTARETQGSTRAMNRALSSVGKAKPDLDSFTGLLGAGLGRSERRALLGSRGVRKAIESGPAQAKPNTAPFAALLSRELGGIRSTARSGGEGIGLALGQGIDSGLGNAVGGIVASAQAAVAAALEAARRRADSRSPSRETMKIGRDLGAGFVVGLRATRGDVERETSGLIDRALQSGDSSAARAFRRVEDGRRARSTATAAPQGATLPQTVILEVDGRQFTAFVRTQARDVSRREYATERDFDSILMGA